MRTASITSRSRILGYWIIVILSSPSFGMIPDKAGINLPFRSIVTSICAFAVECEIGSKIGSSFTFFPTIASHASYVFSSICIQPKKIPPFKFPYSTEIFFVKCFHFHFRNYFSDLTFFRFRKSNHSVFHVCIP